MGEQTGIGWTQATWNPWHGCHKIAPECKNCYMFRDKKRYGQNPTLVVRSKTKFDEPTKLAQPTVIFTCSWSDWLVEEADPWRDDAYEIIRATPRHTYQILTKRIDRAPGRWPGDLRNAWLGVSVGVASRKDHIDMLREQPAALKFVSLEPLLEDLGELDLREIGWGIVGGESDYRNPRQMELVWLENIVRQFSEQGVPLFVKQDSGWRPGQQGRIPDALFVQQMPDFG